MAPPPPNRLQLAKSCSHCSFAAGWTSYAGLGQGYVDAAIMVTIHAYLLLTFQPALTTYPLSSNRRASKRRLSCCQHLPVIAPSRRWVLAASAMHAEPSFSWPGRDVGAGAAPGK